MIIDDKYIIRISIIVFVIGLSLLYVMLQIEIKAENAKNNKQGYKTNYLKFKNIYGSVENIITEYSKDKEKCLGWILYVRTDADDAYIVKIYAKTQNESIDLNIGDKVEVYGYLETTNVKGYVNGYKINNTEKIKGLIIANKVKKILR